MDLQIAYKLLLATILGGIIGIEREVRDKPAGLRTNILICLGSTLFMAISQKAAAFFGGDPTRIAAQIITGIGFLGAGAVLHAHGFVLGLTTAATIWVVAGVGMAIGSGLYGTAVFTTVMTMITLYLLAFIENRIQGNRVYNYALVVNNLEQSLTSINKVLKDASLSSASFNFRKNAKNYHLWFKLSISQDDHVRLVEQLSKLPEVVQVESGKGPRDFVPKFRPSDYDEGGP